MVEIKPELPEHMDVSTRNARLRDHLTARGYYVQSYYIDHGGCETIDFLVVSCGNVRN